MGKVKGWWVAEHLLQFDGKDYNKGDRIEVTPEMAAHFGDSFAEEKVNPPAPKVEKPAVPKDEKKAPSQKGAAKKAKKK